MVSMPVAFVASVGLCCVMLLSVANIIKSGKPTKNNDCQTYHKLNVKS